MYDIRTIFKIYLQCNKNTFEKMYEILHNIGLIKNIKNIKGFITEIIDKKLYL